MSRYLDRDGYLTYEALEKIRVWDWKDILGLMDFVKDLWRFKDGFEVTPGKEWILSTGGWSGNEGIIWALEENLVFWGTYWYSSKRGGRYVFDLSRAPKKNKERR